MSSNNNFDSNDSNRPNGFDFASLSPPSLRPAPPSSLGLVYNQQNESNEPVEDVDIMGMLNKLDEIEPRDAQESERVLEMRARLHRIMVNKAYARFETAIAYNGTLEPNDYAPTFSMREFLVSALYPPAHIYTNSPFRVNPSLDDRLSPISMPWL
jgi:hypothetical protein